MDITNWDKWQTFRKDRGTPPWIKVYRNLLSNEEWVSLSDEEKGQLVSIWLLAADKRGSIPESSKTIMRMAMLDSEPNINKFIELGFLSSGCQPADNHMATSSADTVPDVTHQSRVEESRVEESRVEESNVAALILDHLNTVTGKSFKPVNTNLKLINARLNQGHTQNDIVDVIDLKTKEWLGDQKMERFLRPKTLFGDEKFNQYVGEIGRLDPYEREMNDFFDGVPQNDRPPTNDGFFGKTIRGEVIDHE